MKTLIRSALLSLAIAAPTALPAENAGAYLAARQAASENQFETAAGHFKRALDADPDNLELLRASVYLGAVLGDLDNAAVDARTVLASGDEVPHAAVVLLVQQAQSGAWQDILDELDTGQHSSPAIDSLVRPWALVGLGRMEDALAAFRAAAAEQGLSVIAARHEALALALAGDMEGANALLADPANSAMEMRDLALARAQILAQLDRRDDALTLLEQRFGPAEGDTAVSELRGALLANEAVPFTAISGPADGIAQALSLVAAAHLEQSNGSQALLHARLAEALSPGLTDAILVSAESYLQLDRPDLAAAAFGAIQPGDPALPQAQMGSARAYDAAGDQDRAIAALRALTETRPDAPEVWSLLADVLRRGDALAQAEDAYSRALDLVPEETQSRWVLLYARAIVRHDLDKWPDAEADFRAALVLNPDSPNVLNYLGYSLVERNEKLDEALGMIERAVERAPDNGAIVDSLAWALYRLGRVEEAVPHMERAAELEPTDPVVSDHLGDVLWSVGRRDEGRFQWQRALSFDPEPEQAEIIRRKLESGLPQSTAP